MSKRQNAREADGAGSLWETNGQDVQAFSQENVTPISRLVQSNVGNREEAEDLPSQVFLNAVRGMNPERGSQAVRKWLYQVARALFAGDWRHSSLLPTGSLDDLLDAGWVGAPGPFARTAVRGCRLCGCPSVGEPARPALRWYWWGQRGGITKGRLANRPVLTRVDSRSIGRSTKPFVHRGR